MQLLYAFLSFFSEKVIPKNREKNLLVVELTFQVELENIRFISLAVFEYSRHFIDITHY